MTSAILAIVLLIVGAHSAWLDYCLVKTNDRVSELERQAIERR